MRDIGNYLKVIYSFSATIDKLRKTDITLDCGVTINTAAMSMMNVVPGIFDSCGICMGRGTPCGSCESHG